MYLKLFHMNCRPVDRKERDECQYDTETMNCEVRLKTDKLWTVNSDLK